MTETNTGDAPWAAMPLPLPVLVFHCIGRTWHDDPSGDPGYLTWLPGIAGSHEYGKAGFYCESCTYGVQRAAQKAGLPFVTRPTLEEELVRRGLGHLLDFDEWLPLLAPTLLEELRNRRMRPTEPPKE